MANFLFRDQYIRDLHFQQLNSDANLKYQFMDNYLQENFILLFCHHDLQASLFGQLEQILFFEGLVSIMFSMSFSNNYLIK